MSKRARDSSEPYRRIADAWREMRRGSPIRVHRDLLFEGLEIGQIDTLDLLTLRPSWRMIELATALRIDRTTLTRGVDRLEKAGIAIRSSAGKSKSSKPVAVSITPAGRTLHRKVVERRLVLIRQILSSFTSDEIDELARLLEKVVFGIDQVVGHAGQDNSSSSRIMFSRGTVRRKKPAQRSDARVSTPSK